MFHHKTRDKFTFNLPIFTITRLEFISVSYLNLLCTNTYYNHYWFCFSVAFVATGRRIGSRLSFSVSLLLKLLDVAEPLVYRSSAENSN